MATATCSQCNKIDFAPKSTACKSCGAPYDDATQARIRLDSVREAQLAGSVTSIAQESKTDRPKRAPNAAPKSKSVTSIGGLVTVIAVIATLTLCSRKPSTSEQRSSVNSPKPTSCASEDAQCLGEREIELARVPCKRAIESSVGATSRWTYGLLEEPFNQVGWYMPLSTIIYTGNQLEAGAAGYKRSYYCVWNPATHSIVKASVNN